MNAFDTTVYHWINGLARHHTIFNPVFGFIAHYALELYAVFFVVVWFTLPKQARNERHALVIAGCSGILALVFNVILSHIYFRPRPFAILPHGTFTQVIPHPPDASFPSDHVSGGAGFATASWGRNAKWVSYSFTIFTVVVAFARVFSGVHWPTDVIASFVVGYIASRIMWKLSRFIYPLTQVGLKMFNHH
jgi:undecaprenyl-diphosphatase